MSASTPHDPRPIAKITDSTGNVVGEATYFIREVGHETPKWAVVRSDAGMHRFVPLVEAQPAGEDVKAPVEQADIIAAPSYENVSERSARRQLNETIRYYQQKSFEDVQFFGFAARFVMDQRPPGPGTGTKPPWRRKRRGRNAD